MNPAFIAEFETIGSLHHDFRYYHVFVIVTRPITTFVLSIVGTVISTKSVTRDAIKSVNKGNRCSMMFVSGKLTHARCGAYVQTIRTTLYVVLLFAYFYFRRPLRRRPVTVSGEYNTVPIVLAFTLINR